MEGGYLISLSPLISPQPNFLFTNIREPTLNEKKSEIRFGNSIKMDGDTLRFISIFKRMVMRLEKVEQQ
jgi:hypothetical protein